jgi:hypothetical protein
MPIVLYGPLARIAIVVMAILGFLLALGDVLDFYDALWMFTVPATVVYAVVIWVFVLAPAKGEAKPEATWPLGLDVILVKLMMTVALLLTTLGVIALGYDLVGLVIHNWPLILLALGVVVVIIGWAMLPERKRRKARAGEAEPKDLVS